MANHFIISASNNSFELFNWVKVQVPALLHARITAQSDTLRHKVQWELGPDERPNHWFHLGRHLSDPNPRPTGVHKKIAQNRIKNYHQCKINCIHKWSHSNSRKSDTTGLQCCDIHFESQEQDNFQDQRQERIPIWKWVPHELLVYQGCTQEEIKNMPRNHRGLCLWQVAVHQVLLQQVSWRHIERGICCFSLGVIDQPAPSNQLLDVVLPQPVLTRPQVYNWLWKVLFSLVTD